MKKIKPDKKNHESKDIDLAKKRTDSSFNGLLNHSMDKKTGAIDGKKMQDEEGRYGSNGGRGCDVRGGPCSCGAWHQ